MAARKNARSGHTCCRGHFHAVKPSCDPMQSRNRYEKTSNAEERVVIYRAFLLVNTFITLIIRSHMFTLNLNLMNSKQTEVN